MKTKLTRTLAALGFALLTSSAAHAHGGHHHLMGTVTAVQPSKLELKTRDGKAVSVELTDKTIYKKGKEAAKASDVRVGERIMIDTDAAKESPVAVEVKLGAMRTPSPSPSHDKQPAH